MKALLYRERYHASGMKWEWKWLYSVSIEGARPVAIGTLLSDAMAWAKRRGAKTITKAWEVK